MKFILSCAYLILLALIKQKVNAEHSEEFEKVRTECHAELGITDMGLKEFKFDGSNEYKCLPHCMISKMGYLDEDGKIKDDKIEEIAEKSGHDVDTINDCRAMNDMTDEKCEYASNMIMCVMEGQ